MKATKCTVFIIIFFVWVFFILPSILFRIPSFQKEMSNITSKYLKEKIGTKVDIDRIKFQFFNKLTLEDAYLEDESGNVLFFAKRIVIGLDFFSLFKHQIRINFARIYTFTFNLTRKSVDTPLNIQYIIDVFFGKKEKKKNVEISIRNLSLKDGSFSYQVKNKKPTTDKFNINDIHLNDIVATIQLYKFTDTIFRANIDRLSFVEKSGFQVKRLAFDLLINNNNIRINRFGLDLPASHLLLTGILAKYNHLENIFTDKTHFNFQLESSKISLKDICSIIPIFSCSQTKLEVMGKFGGKLDSFKVTNLTVNESNNMKINADIKIYHLNNSLKAYTYAVVKNAYITPLEIQKISDNFNLKSKIFFLLKERFGIFFFNGKISGNLNKLNTNVNISTEIGSLQADIQFLKKTTGFLSGKIIAFSVNMRRLTNNNDFNSVPRFVINLNSTFDSHWKNWKGNIETSVKEFGYKSSYYKSIYLSGDFTSSSFKGFLETNSPDGKITAKGFFLLKGAQSEFNFLAKVSDIAFDKLYSVTKYKNLRLSFVVNANLMGSNIDNFTGNIAFRKLKFSTDKNAYLIDSISISAETNWKNKKRLLLHSDIVDGEIEGIYSIKNLAGILQDFLTPYLDSSATFERFVFNNEKNDFKIDLIINNTQKLFSLLELPISTYQQLHINLKYNSLQNQLCLNVHCPYLDIGDYKIENVVLNLDNEKGYAELNLNGITSFKQKDNDNNNNKFIVFANCKIQNDSIYSFIGWESDGERQYLGRLNFVASLEPQKINPKVFVQICAPKLIVDDSVWIVTPVNIIYDRQTNKISINHFIAKCNEQIITINGDISENKNDLLHISLSKINVGRIFKLLHTDTIDIGGFVTGNITMKDVFQTRKVTVNLNIHQFIFNNVTMGYLRLCGQWNENKQCLKVKGGTVNGSSASIDIDGLIYPMKKKISIIFDIHNAKIDFLHKYLDDLLSDLSGELIGKIRLFGNLNNLLIEGNAWVSNGKFRVKFINTYYTFNNWVKFTPYEISFHKMELYDKYKNKAIINASIKYNAFNNFQFTTVLSCKNLLVLDVPPNFNSLFYGNIFVTGSATISGNRDFLSIKASLHNNENTNFTLNFAKIPYTTDYDFVKFFKKKHTEKIGIGQERNMTNSSKPEIYLNLIADINNSANLKVVIDPTLENTINLIGSGRLKIQYSMDAPLKVFGKYIIEKGKYHFNLKQFFFRNFEIIEGSSISFGGNPFTADIDAKASCSISADIRDLGVNIGNRHLNIRNKTLVNCIFLLSGQLKSPDIKFDLEFPEINFELENEIKNYMFTNDIINQQILYLLFLGRFYHFSETVRTNNDLYFLTCSSISSQLSDIWEEINSKFKIGMRFHPSEANIRKNTEVELLFSGMLLNNRLIINSNFNYLDNSLYNASLIGDYDIEYKLTKSGNIRIKGFNHYNRDIYEATRSIGIIFQKDF